MGQLKEHGQKLQVYWAGSRLKYLKVFIFRNFGHGWWLLLSSGNIPAINCQRPSCHFIGLHGRRTISAIVSNRNKNCTLLPGERQYQHFHFKANGLILLSPWRFTSSVQSLSVETVEGGLVKNPLLFYLDPSNSHNGNLSPWCWNVKEKQEKRQAIKSRRTYIAIIMLTAINFVVIECLMAVDVSDNANWLQ